MSLRTLAGEISTSKDSIHRILKSELQCQVNKKKTEPLLTDGQKDKRIKFANWVQNSFRKEKTLRILYSGKKVFDINGQ